jgi:recombinational DNA repair protein RecR
MRGTVLCALQAARRSTASDQKSFRRSAVGANYEDGVSEVIVATTAAGGRRSHRAAPGARAGCRQRPVSRIASGVPHGGDLDLADQITLGRD